jgi:5-formyltetrahydrofolate cyclo-ligase
MHFYSIASLAELRKSSYGILEPGQGARRAVPENGDLMIVPAAAFDTCGYRIGYGGGYYDKYLNKIFAAYGYKPYCMALGFACQIHTGKIPAEEHDKKMDCILTERRVIMPKEENQGKLGAIADVVEIVIELVLELVAELID